MSARNGSGAATKAKAVKAAAEPAKKGGRPRKASTAVGARPRRGDYSARIVKESPDPNAYSESARELNLVAFPLGNLSGRDKSNSATFKVVRVVNGELSEQFWTVKTAGTALPGPMERRVLAALTKIATDQGLTDRRVEFTRYQIANLLPHEAKAKGGGYLYRKIDTALRNLVGVTISTNLFYDATTDSYREQHFHILEKLDLAHSKNPKKRTVEDEARAHGMIEDPARKGAASRRKQVPKSSLQWSDVVFDSIRAGNFTYIDHNLSLRLKSPTAVRLHEFLDGEWKERHHVAYDIAQLAHERIGISRKYVHVSELTRALEPGFQELELHGYLVANSTVVKGRSIHFYRNPDYRAPRESGGEVIEAVPLSAKPEKERWVDELTARGVNERVAHNIIEKAGAEKLARMPEFLQRFEEDLKAGVIKSNAQGYLVKMIQDGWKPRGRGRSAAPQPSLFGDAQRQPAGPAAAPAGDVDEEYLFGLWEKERGQAALAALSSAEREALLEEVVATTSALVKERKLRWNSAQIRAHAEGLLPKYAAQRAGLTYEVWKNSR